MSTRWKNVGSLESFSRSLTELTINSKPHINFLTRIAKDSSYQAEAIVDAVQTHLKKTPCNMKLLTLYLIDSIMKNVGKEYIPLFSTVLVSEFPNIYAEVDTSTQQSMGMLRQTWDGILSPSDLSRIDVQVHTLDQQWQLPSDTLKNTTVKILLNPNFLPKFQRVPPKDSVPEEPSKPDEDLTDEVDEADILREQLLLQKKQRELLKRKLQVEKIIAENNNEEIIEGSCETPIIIDLEERESQADSTTVDKPHDLPSLDTSTEVQSSTSAVSTTLDTPVPDKRLSGELLELLSDLISKQNQKSQHNENQSAKTKDTECSNELNCTSGRYSERYARRKSSSKSSHKYHYSRNKSTERNYEDRNSNRRHKSNKYRQIYRNEMPSCKSVSKDILCDQSLPTSPGRNEDLSQSKESKLSTGGDSSVTPSNHSSAAQSSQETSLSIQAAYSGLSHSGKSPSDLHRMNSIPPDHERSVNLDVRYYKRPLLPTPSSPALGLGHSITQFTRTLSKKKEIKEIKVQKEIDYNHGFGCPENIIEGPSSSHHVRSQQPLPPPPMWYPSSPVEYLPRQSLVNECTEGPQVSLPPASNYILGKIAQDTVKNIPVNSITKEVQFYGETAVIDAGENNPREITFQAGEAAISLNNIVVHCAFNQPEIEVYMGGKIFWVRLGAPTRELYVNDEPFQCQFNFPPKHIQLSSGEVFQVQVYSKMSPLVEIGAMRRDLVAGHVTLTIDSTHSLRILLHAKPQRFDIDGVPHILKFADALQTIFINDYMVDIKFGGPPIFIAVNGVKHQVQLSDLPFDVIPGKVYITSMAQTEHLPLAAQFGPPHEPLVASLSGPPITMNTFEREKRKQKFKHERSKKRKINSRSRKQILSRESKNPEIFDPPNYYPNTNINTLFQSLCEVGLLIPKGQSSGPEKVKPSDLEVYPVDFKDLSTLKRKQPGIIEIIYSGVQCSSCGVRFPAELTDVYRQHLDWHFHQNHKTRYSTKFHNRPWYSERREWVQSDSHGDKMDTEDEPISKECDGGSIENCSVPSHGYPQGAVCDMCGDMFDEFFNEDQDEWHLKNCVTFGNKLYHPACFSDSQATEMNDDKPVMNDIHQATEMNDDKPVMNDIHQATEMNDDKPVMNDIHQATEMNDDKPVMNDNNTCQESGERSTDCAMDVCTEIDSGQVEDLTAIENPDISSVISIDNLPETKEIECTVLDPDISGSSTLDGQDETSQGETKVGCISLTKASVDEKTEIEINKIETNDVELSSGGVEAAPSSSPSATLTEIIVSRPTICDNSSDVLETSIPNDSKKDLVPLLSSGSVDEKDVFLKPKLVGRKLSKLPPTNKGSETTNMCILS